MDEDRVTGAINAAAGKVQGLAGDVTGDSKMQAEGRLNDLAGQAQNTYGRAKDTLRGTVDAISEQARTAASSAQQQMGTAGDSIGAMVQEQPVAALLTAGAVGYLLAFFAASSLKQGQGFALDPPEPASLDSITRGDLRFHAPDIRCVESKPPARDASQSRWLWWGPGAKPRPFYFLVLTRSSTTAGSARVDVSPRLSTSLAAILRRIRRIILPLRVLGSPGAQWITSGAAIGPISRRTHATSSCRSASVGSTPSFSVT